MDEQGGRIRQLEEEILKLRAELGEISRANAELQKKNDSLESTFKRNPEIAFYQTVADPDLPSELPRAVAYVSPNFQTLTGIPNVLDPEVWVASVHPDDIDKIIKGNQEAIKTGLFDEVFRIFHGERNEWRWFKVTSADTEETEGSVKVFNGVVLDVTELKRAEHLMLEYQRQLQALNQNQTAIEERERRRVAEILHDDVGQDLAVALFKMNQIKDMQNSSGTVMDEVMTLIGQAIEHTRTLTKELCPPALCQMGVASGIKWLTAQTPDKYGFETRLTILGDLAELPQDLGTVIFRIIAELLNNVAKHAAADSVRVEVALNGGTLRLLVLDDGDGFDYSEEFLHESGGFGLFAISERLRSLEGKLDIKSQPGKGARVSVELPVAA